MKKPFIKKKLTVLVWQCSQVLQIGKHLFHL